MTRPKLKISSAISSYRGNLCKTGSHTIRICRVRKFNCDILQGCTRNPVCDITFNTSTVKFFLQARRRKSHDKKKQAKSLFIPHSYFSDFNKSSPYKYIQHIYYHVIRFLKERFPEFLFRNNLWCRENLSLLFGSSEIKHRQVFLDPLCFFAWRIEAFLSELFPLFQRKSECRKPDPEVIPLFAGVLQGHAQIIHTHRKSLPPPFLQDSLTLTKYTALTFV